ncbi:MAG: hypothetical protein ACYCOU_26445, partial [Sulfobacillus sp.]
MVRKEWTKRAVVASLVMGLVGGAGYLAVDKSGVNSQAARMPAEGASVSAHAAAWWGTPVAASGAPALPAVGRLAAPPAQGLLALRLPSGTDRLVRALLTPRPAQGWTAARARGVEVTTPIVRGGQSGRQRTSTPFTTGISPGNWTWKNSQQTFLQRGNGLLAFYGSQLPSGVNVLQAASPYQYSFAMFPDQEYTLVQVMLSTRAKPAGFGSVAGQRVVWLEFTHGSATLKVAVDAATDQILAVQGLEGLIGNNPPARIEDRVTSYTVVKGAPGAVAGAGTSAGATETSSRPASQGPPVTPMYGGERTDLRVFSSFREAQRATPFPVLAPRLQPVDLLWSLGLADGQLQAVIMTPTGEATVSEAFGYPSSSSWAFSPVGKGIAITGASAGAGFGAYGRFGGTGVIISTYENGSIGEDATPSLQAWIHRFPSVLE